jgi:cyclomaltodextrinase / maltogenic alpha-amylase / neopullulanase
MNIPDWVQDAIFYQIFPDRFAKSERLGENGIQYEAWDTPPTQSGFKGGDLYGVAEKLDYLQDLGITALYLNPVFASASNHRYHTYDYYEVDPLLGGNDALRHLLGEAHQRGMRVILDGVFNHASRGFWQFHHVLETGAASPYKDWFHFDPDRLNAKKQWGAYPSPEEVQEISREGSYKAIGYHGWWNLPALPKFKTETPAVRKFLFEVAEYWIRFGIDGWRLDVPAEIDDDSFWREFRQRVRAINPEAYLVGEIWHESQRWLQGDQFDAVMNYLMTAAALSFCGGSRLDMNTVNQAGGLQGRVHPMDAREFASELDRIHGLYPRPVTYAQMNLLDSHDMPRFLSCVSGDKTSLKLAWLLMFTVPGAPCVYYGDEIGIDGGHDPDCRKSFPWDAASWDQDLLAYLKACVKLRKDNSALRRGEFRSVATQGNTYVFSRTENKDEFLIVLNAGDEEQGIEIPEDGRSGTKYKPVFGQAKISTKGHQLHLQIGPRSSAVLQSRS